MHIYSVAFISPLGLIFKPESPSFKDVLSKVWLKLAPCSKVLPGKCEKLSMKMTLIRKGGRGGGTVSRAQSLTHTKY